MHEFTRAHNHFYLAHPCLHREDTGFYGYRWLSVDDADHSVIAFVRRDGHSRLVCVFNFTPVTHDAYRIPMDEATKTAVTLHCAFSTHGRENIEIRTAKVRKGERYALIPLYPFEAAFYEF